MLLLTPLLAFLLCTILHGGALWIFPRLQLLDFPQRYGLHRRRLPYPTGILAILTFLLFLAIYFPWNTQNIGLATAIVTLGIVSFLDDRHPLPPSARLFIQIFAATIIFTTGSRIYTITNPLGFLTGIPYIKLDAINIPSQFPISQTPLPLLSGLFTILWLGFAMNALNWFDGIPGQVSTLSIIGFLVIGTLALSSRVNQPNIALFAFVLAGIAGACTLFDFPPPQVLMGDTGAMFFGLMLGILTIYAGGKIATAFLVFGVPFTDCLIVITRRMLQRKSPFRGSTNGEHLHHRLLARGWSPHAIIAVNLAIGLTFGISALFLNTFFKFVTAGILVFLLLALAESKNLHPGTPDNSLHKK